MTAPPRRYRVGAELAGRDRLSVRLWAPEHARVQVVVDGDAAWLQGEGDGHFSAVVPGHVGSRYGFRVPGDDRVLPDPASRSLPDGPDGLSAVVDLDAYVWHDEAWPGVSLEGQVLYELHVGTFTADGTWRAAAARLPALRELGITTIQMMPVAEFAGRFGWGYDGVQWFAPYHHYGVPADLQHFVDTAHGLGLAVILDVVFNHLGPAGNYLGVFDPRWQSSRHANEWGEALNFDGDGAAAMRDLVLDNVRYWIEAFHLDGLRLDATQQIVDDSPEHLVAALTRAARAAAHPRPVLLVAEDERQQARQMRPAHGGGYGLDAIFNEDFHHSCRVALTGSREAYLSDYRGTSREWLAAALHGFLYQGQYYPWQQQARGAPALDREPRQFVCFLENHDQVANGANGRRLIDLTSESWWRAMSALLLLGPWTPLLFQGQEDGTATPFRYFADHAPTLQQAVMTGRRAFLDQFARFAASHPPSSPDEHLGADVFASCRLTPGGPRAERCRRLHADLLTLRRTDPVLATTRERVSGAALGDRTLLLRYGGNDDARLLVVNLDPDRDLAAEPEPLLAPPAAGPWQVAWCSADQCYGGNGYVPAMPPARLIATGHAATVFSPARTAL